MRVGVVSDPSGPSCVLRCGSGPSSMLLKENRGDKGGADGESHGRRGARRETARVRAAASAAHKLALIPEGIKAGGLRRGYEGLDMWNSTGRVRQGSTRQIRVTTGRIGQGGAARLR